MEITSEVAHLGESLSRRHTRHGEKFSLGTLTPSSASATFCDESTATPRNPARQNAGPFLGLPEFKCVLEAISYQELMPDPFDFDSHNPRRVMEITFEVARLGESGLDYANAEKKYTLAAYPGYSFSGLQLMCIMYAGFSHRRLFRKPYLLANL